MEQVITWFTSLSATSFVIHMGAVVSAVGLIIVGIRKLTRWIAGVYKKVSFVFSEQHDHAVINEKLDWLTEQFKKNGGTSATDKLDKIIDMIQENALKQHILDARIKTALHIHDTPVFETDANGDVTYVNQAYTRMAGISAHELMGEGWKNVVPQRDREDSVRKWMDAVHGKYNYDGDHIFVKPDGTEYAVHVAAHVIKDAAGGLVGHFGKVIVEDKHA